MQIKRIHILKNLLGLDETLYRDMLASFGVCSSKNLTFTEASIFIEILEEMVQDLEKLNLKKYDELTNRDENMATPLQLRKIEALWKHLDKSENRHKNLRTFIKNKFGVSDIRFTTKKIASSLIFVIEKMIYKKSVKGV
ncbi:MAG: phage protein GemA/Gp16 family protein [Candidatus Gastranaerophilales bacterium]